MHVHGNSHSVSSDDEDHSQHHLASRSSPINHNQTNLSNAGESGLYNDTSKDSLDLEIEHQKAMQERE